MTKSLQPWEKRTNPVFAYPTSTASLPKQLDSYEPDDMDIQDQERPKYDVVYQSFARNRSSTGDNIGSESYTPTTLPEPTNSLTGPILKNSKRL